MTEKLTDKEYQDVIDASKNMQRFLTGREPEEQGAILAELLSIWLVGHISGTAEDTKRLREMLLTEHIKAVQMLVVINEAEFLTEEREAAKVQ